MENNKLNSVLDKVLRLCQQEPEFDRLLREKLNVQTVLDVDNLSDSRLSEIYEYCIEQITKKQAEEFYKDFPYIKLKEYLIKDYCRMEHFRRTDNYEDFALAVYQQIECITNFICNNPKVSEIANKLWAYNASLAYNASDREYIGVGKKSVATLVILGKGKEDVLEKIKKGEVLKLSELNAIPKMRAVIYFIIYKGQMKSSDYSNYTNLCDILYKIYMERNKNHRGNNINKDDSTTLEISTNYLSFYSALFLFIKGVTEGISEIDNTYDYAMKL